MARIPSLTELGVLAVLLGISLFVIREFIKFVFGIVLEELLEDRIRAFLSDAGSRIKTQYFDSVSKLRNWVHNIHREVKLIRWRIVDTIRALRNEDNEFPELAGYYPRSLGPEREIEFVDMLESDSGFFSTTFSDEMVFVGTDDGIVYGIEQSPLEEKWRFEAGGNYIFDIVELDDLLFFSSWGSDDKLYGLNKSDGEERWNFSKETLGNPDSLGENIYVQSSNGSLYALNDRGEELWDSQTGAPVSDVVCGENILYIIPDGRPWEIQAIDLPAKRTRWRFESELETAVNPVVTGESLFWHNGANVFSIDPQTGKEIWCKETKVDFTRPLSVDDESLYLISEEYDLVSLNRETGDQEWIYETDGNTSLPTITNDIIYLGLGEGIHLIDPDDGENIKTFEILDWTPNSYQNTSTAGMIWRSRPYIKDGDLIIGGRLRRSKSFISYYSGI